MSEPTAMHSRIAVPEGAGVRELLLSGAVLASFLVAWSRYSRRAVCR